MEEPEFRSGTSNLDLATLLSLLADYGRLSMNQMSGCATPGTKAAGSYHCEVAIAPISPEEMRALQDVEPVDYWQMYSTGARCIGVDMDPTAAARKCLQQCQRMMEGRRARFLRPVSTALAQRIEQERKEGGPIR